MIEVVSPGLLTTVQDAGRRGFENYGVPRSGFFDAFLARIANKLAGNHEDAALLEFAAVGPTLRFQRESWVAVAGFSLKYVCNGSEVPEFSAVRIAAGSVLEFHDMKGWFGYIAVAGGMSVPRVLGSSSTYLAGRIGKRVEKGDQFYTGRSTGTRYRIEPSRLHLSEKRSVPILPAHHTSSFGESERERLALLEFYVSSQSNRMGIRLDGPELKSPAAGRSVPTYVGTVQIPRSGKPILLGPEGPTTGGYPQIAIVAASGWTSLAGTRPGESIRFHWIDPEKARELKRSRERIFTNSSVWEEVG